MAWFHQTQNSTLISIITPTSVQSPFYHVTTPSVLPFISDKHLSLLSPVLVYWAVSFAFHLLDTAKLPYFEAKRLHESPEVLSRNRATVSQVVKAVIVQHIIQTVFGVLWLEDEETILRTEVYRDHLGTMSNLAPHIADATLLVLGKNTGEQLLRSHGEAIVRWTYWWGIPMLQMYTAFLFIDTWQYFMHRAFHSSRFLYRQVHSVHHRLYVPYAFGALYNHPLEGLLFDTLGAGIALEVARMSVRQSILLFTLSTIKTVDDHSGYKIWWDPCQLFFANNADYHDIHHQAYGIKANFSQPFFTNWDKWLGTLMTRDDVARKTRRVEKVE